MERNDAIDILQHHGIKATANRIIIVEALAEQERPLTLMELEEEIGSIDKSGIFRVLSLFKSRHLVHVIEDGGDGVRYELCRSSHEEGDDDTHVHFYCESCRKTFCLNGIAIPQVNLPEGFVADSVNYMVKGICPVCNKRD